MFNNPQIQSTFNPQDVEKNKLIVTLCYIFPILFFLPAVMDPNSTFCKHHSNQILSWLIVGVCIGVVSGILGLIPILGAILSIFISVGMLVLLILLAMSAYQGNAVVIPVIGEKLVVFK